MSVGLHKSTMLLLHRLGRVCSPLVLSLALLFITMLVIAINNGMRNIPMQDVGHDGDAKCA